MRLAVACVLVAVAQTLALAGEVVQGQVSLHRVPGNIVKNASFEHNWFNRAFADRRRFLLLQGSDMGVGEEDGHIDHWRVEGAPVPECWDLEVARTGSRSVRLDAAGRCRQLVRFAGEQYWQAGGAHYAMFLPMAGNLATKLSRRPIVVGAWCRTKGVPKGAEPRLVVTVESDARASYEKLDSTLTAKMEASASFSGGTHDWEYRQVRIYPKAFRTPDAPAAAPLEDAFKDEAAALEGPRHEYEFVPNWVWITLQTGQGGTVWFDDVSCVEEPSADLPNRVPNASFEALDDAGWPVGWSKPEQWGWFRNTYYAWTGWSHWEAKQSRGGAVLDRMLAFSGNASLRFNVLPGDNFAVRTEPIELNQDVARPIEARAMVKADNLRTLEIMAQDQNGQWLPQGDFLGDDMEEPGAYNFGTTGAGTYDWMCVRKYFSPRGPVKSLRLFLCARGFDGAIVAGKNIVGTVWWDDVELLEHGVAAGQLKPGAAPVQPKACEALYPFRVVDVDLGDRLWGLNVVKLLLEFPGKADENVRLNVRLTDPSGLPITSAGTQKKLTRAALSGREGECLVVSDAFELKQFCRSWQEQYRLGVQLSLGDKPAPPAEFYFGTPSEILSARTSAFYAYPDEKVAVAANLNISRDALAWLRRCEVLVRAGDAVARRVQVEDLAGILKPQRSLDDMDTRRLLQTDFTAEGLTVHPWGEPTLDYAATVTVELKGPGQTDLPLTAESGAVRFGFLERPPKPDFPDKIEKTAVNDRGYITINGKPWFPVFWTPHFGILPEADYPPSHMGYKTLDLTKVVYSKDAMPDEEVKARVLAEVSKVKDDPRFFQYELGEGEMQLQGKGWEDRVEWCKKAIGWIREADPNHVVNGPVSWLVGHPHHNEAMKRFVPDWDVIGVEASFEQQPLINENARPLMKTRKTAVLVGLETYFYQPNETLRWRGYRAVLNGASGIGLCPSGMLQSRPDKVNYLRGLNCEFRGLAPVITADEPPDKLTLDSALVDTMERLLDGKRYVFAVRNRDDAGAVQVRFSFPKGQRYSEVRALFENRTVPVKDDGFEDGFARGQTVHVYRLKP